MTELYEALLFFLLLACIIMQYAYLRIKNFDVSLNKKQSRMFHQAGVTMLLLFSLFLFALAVFISVFSTLNWDALKISIGSEILWILIWFKYGYKTVGYSLNALIIFFLLSLSFLGWYL